MGGEGSALLAIAQRDVLKLLRDAPRLAVSLAFPVLLIAGLGSVLQPTVGRVTGVDAVTLAFAGVLAATLFQSTAAGMISLAEDRETDFARELFVTPVSRLTLVVGKILGESGVALLQGVCVVVCALPFGVAMSWGQLARMLPVAAACCLLGGAFGLGVVAWLPNQRSAMQVFQFLIIPQYVLGGVLVPLHGLPGWAAAAARAMPLRYAVQLGRAAYFAGRPGYPAAVGAGSAAAAWVVVAVLFAVLLTGGVLVFDRRERAR
ncbi:ABC transporter permease [Phaeacidiphilus oryzae]|uniref:ABC transporter permease n=1 Tax=Phaeacidiphilus oryzae TaxID=348818 RepID=UPI000567A09C|nr:ABC transporter permease [Phaeacidiphilus oryzae]